MTKDAAIAQLSPYRRTVLRDVYDSPEFPAAALLTLCPTFEYPEWDWLTVAAFLKKHA